MERTDTVTAGGASRIGARLLANKERILSLWEERVRSSVPAAKTEPHPILIDTLPALLRQIAQALSPAHPRRTATEGSSIAEEHGGDRARVTRFKLEDVIEEYRVLRGVLFEVLEEAAQLSSHERAVLDASLDESIAKACTAYALVETGLREQLFATIAHDIRGPLSAAKVSVELMLRKPGDVQQPRWAARAADAIDRVDRMLRDLLDAMRMQSGGRLIIQLEECDLVDVARQAVENQEAEHGSRFVLVSTHPVRGYFAAEPLRRAMENLVQNAVKYGASERPITVTVRQTHQRAFVMVHNHGGAIPAEQQDMLFRLFQRLPHADSGGKRGWGLGLAQVRGAAEAHGGSVTIDSLPERGTTFTIDIPLDSRSLQPAPTLAGQ